MQCDGDLDALATSFIGWAKHFLKCNDAQAQQLLSCVHRTLDQSAGEIPSMLVQDPVPFSYCQAYRRQMRRAGESAFRCNVDQLTSDLTAVAIDLGVVLPSLKTDSVAFAKLPTIADLSLDIVSSEFLSQCTVQLDRCFELMDSYPERHGEIIPVSEDVLSILSWGLSMLRRKVNGSGSGP